MRRGGIHLAQQPKALGQVALGEGIGERPGFHLRSAGHQLAHLALAHRIAPVVGQGDLPQLVVEMHGILAHQIDQGRRSPLAHHDAVARGHGAHLAGQLARLRQSAVDHRLRAHAGHSLVQARVLRQLLGLQKQHRGLVGRTQIGY